ncbi:MAG TPA: M14 family zinc carboxypeptidase, partial [Vicinamibacteria bacterium]|nr:M14 family zinc carboxypeptidase [Vicinamibacteria bacterium]
MGARVWAATVWMLMGAAGAPARAADTPEPGSREAIAAATTEPRFLSPWVAEVPDHPRVPSPSDFLGHIAGAPGELTRTARIHAYYRALDAASERVSVQVIGRSEEGRDILLVAVGDAAALQQLEAHREAAARLADPRRTDEAQMEQVVASARPFYMLHGGLHSTETGSPEMLMELAYRLAVSDAPHVQLVRDKLIVLINPVAEPDGRDRMVDWFYRHLKGKTDYDHLPPVSPPYWGKYVFHDNNRDGIQRKLALTRATQDAFLKWHPVVVHDLHESIPLLSIWTGTGPYNVNVDPSANVEWHTVAFHEVTTLTSFGMPGVWTRGFGEGWAHIYADSVATNHNAIGRGYETFGNATAETVERELDPERNRFAGRPVTEADWFRTVPPPRKFKWSLRNNTNYMQTGVLAALQYTALHAPDLMRNFWRRGQRAVQRGRTEKPYAVAMREEQDDRRRLAALVNLLRDHGIEVGRARAAFKVAEGEYPAGTFLVRMDQPYRGYALDLLLPQKYPIDKAPFEPYDVVAWALPISYGVEVKAIEDASVRDVAVDPVSAPVVYAGGVSGEGGVYLVRDRGQESLLAARARLAAFAVEVAEKPFSAGGRDYRAGSWIVREQPRLREALARAAQELDLEVAAVAQAPDVPRHAADLPRLALLQTWADTESPGWVRMILDDEKVPYTLIMDEDVRRGGLRERFDVILFPNTYDSLKDIVQGIDPRHGPLAYTRTPQFASHGTPTSSADITGGLTWAGVGHIEQFVRAGGVLVTLGGASTLPLDGGIARDVRRARVKDLSNPGSTLRARFRRPDHPIAYGYPESILALREDRPVYQVRRADRGRIVL